MANTTDPIINCLERNWDMIESALAGMDDDMLKRAPAAECNSAAWILWHLSRVMNLFRPFSPAGRRTAVEQGRLGGKV